MTKPKTTKIRWLGPARAIPDLGLTAKPGDTLDLPANLTLGGEGSLWEKAGTKKASTPKED